MEDKETMVCQEHGRLYEEQVVGMMTETLDRELHRRPNKLILKCCDYVNFKTKIITEL